MKHSKMTAGSLAAVAAVLSIAAAYANPGDPLFKLLANDGAAGDFFGSSVAISGTTAIIAATGNTDNGFNSGSAYLFDTTTGLQIGDKLLPKDGAAFDVFGSSVAISGVTAIVGAHGDDDNGEASGSAYLFDITTGLQIGDKLLPNDGATNDLFGSAVAISGTTAIIGAWADDDNGEQSGSAYLFDITTGLQIGDKLLPDDGAAFDNFGFSVAISGVTAIIGSRGDDDNGEDSGSAYLFDITTGLQIGDKLLPNDGATDDLFGLAVAISGTSAIVGAFRDDDNGEDSGSAYLFDTTTGAQIAKLLANDGAVEDFFGRSVAISGAAAIVGAERDDDNGDRSGSAYLFDTATGQQIGKLLPNDGAVEDFFGFSVAISGTTAIVGASLDDDNGSNSGSAYVFTGDSDGDGLFDFWEANGVPYIDKDGALQHFMLPGADPMHKDLYLEVDAMTGLSLSDVAVTLLVNAYSNAPLCNPDDEDGITLHILRDETNLVHVEFWETSPPGFCWPLEFESYRNIYYGEDREQGNAALLGAKAKAYRYCIVADRAGPNRIGGCGEMPGDNFVIFLGATVTTSGRAAVFMHELGHNLSLDHGGGDGINGKPNYPSIMNYVLSYKYAWNNAFWRLDYSREEAGSFAGLDESSLDEVEGIGFFGGFYSDFKMPFGVNELDDDENTIRSVKYVTLDASPTDFGDTRGTMFQDGFFDFSVAQDLNYAVDPPAGISLPGVSSPGETLDPYDDWAHVGLPLAAALGEGAADIDYPTDELTTEARDWIDANFPLPPGACLADLDGDGSVGASDLLALLVSWGPCRGCPADFDGDGNVGASDLLALLANWGPCP